MDEDTKAKHSRRIQLKENHIQKQLKIAKTFGHAGHDKLVREPHRLAKHNVMDCGNPKCIMCSSDYSSSWVEDEKKLIPILQDSLLKNHFIHRSQQYDKEVFKFGCN